MAALLRWRFVALSLLMLVLVAGQCEKPKVLGVTIDSGDVTVAVGASHALTAMVATQYGADPTVAWSSVSPGVATVSSGGVVRGVSVGSTEIVARSTFDPTKRDSILATVVAGGPQRVLTVARAGSGMGTVTSEPAGIVCGATCSTAFADGTSVGLTATPAAGSVFSGWSGACGGMGACTVSMTQARSVTATFTSQLVVGPLNDSFAFSRLLTGPSGTVTGFNRMATKEPGEPNHAFTSGAGGKSVWWHWAAPTTGWVAFDTFGSDFDTMLGVYTGTAVHQLTLIAYGDDASGTLQSRAVFPVRSGVTYRIAVDGYRSVTTGVVAEGDITLNWSGVAAPTWPPLNDAFASGFVLHGASGTTTGSNVNATKQPGEPNHWPANAGGSSVWWVWTAPSTASVTISTFSSTFDTVLAVYTGSALNALTRIAANDDAGTSSQSRVVFPANAGTTYRIAVDGFRSGAAAATGTVVLNWGP